MEVQHCPSQCTSVWVSVLRWDHWRSSSVVADPAGTWVTLITSVTLSSSRSTSLIPTEESCRMGLRQLQNYFPSSSPKACYHVLLIACKALSVYHNQISCAGPWTWSTGLHQRAPPSSDMPSHSSSVHNPGECGRAAGCMWVMQGPILQE